MIRIYRKTWQTDLCNLHLYADDEHLLALAFDANEQALRKKLGLEQAVESHSPIIETTIEQLREYFAGQRKVFQLPLKLAGTDFQVKAWTALADIPYGQSISYSVQAAAMQKAAAVRAVGVANGKNAYSIIIPCHRVVGKDGSLTGYAGGKSVKAALLKLEGLGL